MTFVEAFNEIRSMKLKWKYIIMYRTLSFDSSSLIELNQFWLESVSDFVIVSLEYTKQEAIDLRIANRLESPKVRTTILKSVNDSDRFFWEKVNGYCQFFSRRSKIRICKKPA